MKKVLLACLLVCMASSSAFAITGGFLPQGVGAKYAAMGGAGSAMVDDTTAAYYNPAGIANAQSMSMKLGLGAASDGLNDLINTLSSASDPSKFILDNYANAINVNGSANLFLGIDIAKVGISVIPVTQLQLTKLANTANGSALAMLNTEAAATLGYGLSVPYIGFTNIGANIKYVLQGGGGANIVGSTSTTNTMTYTGFGFDLGAQARLDAIPMMPLAVAVVLKDVGTSLSGKGSTTTKTIDPLTGNVISETKTPDVDLPGITAPTTLVIGAAGKIPVVGAKIAVDLDSVSGGTANLSYSVTHIGIEYPIIGVAAVRLGFISGGPSGTPINMVTYGAGILGDMINIAMITDSNNSKNNQFVFDVGFGL